VPRGIMSIVAGIALLVVVGTRLAILTAQAPSGTPRDAAAALFTDFCANCHGTTPRGGMAPSLLDDSWHFGGDDTSLTTTIREGRPGTAMLGFKAALSDAQIRSLIVYIREQAETARHSSVQLAVAAVVDRLVSSELQTFRIETIAEGVETPWGIAFLPDGRMLVTERPGRLRIVDRGRLLPEAIQGIPAVWQQQDAGLLDVQVHPDYARSGWIYLAYSDPGTNGASMTAVIRGRIRDGHWVDQETIFHAPPAVYAVSNVHYGSRLVFDRTGHLFFSIGDRGTERDAQDLASPNGKIHRVYDDGRIPTDNPFVGRSGAIESIWTYGHRNPQGLAFHPVTGMLWATEHGPRGGDELNRIERGRNYGWPVITYGMNHDGTALSARTAQAGMEQPVIQWTPSIAVCGIEFYAGRRFPNWRHNLFVTALAHEELRRLVVEGDRVVHQEVLFKGLGRVRDVVTGPDGYLYVALTATGAVPSATTPGRIVRLTPGR
jgi:aldose sugar dehydrogenase